MTERKTQRTTKGKTERRLVKITKGTIGRVSYIKTDRKRKTQRKDDRNIKMKTERMTEKRQRHRMGQ